MKKTALSLATFALLASPLAVQAEEVQGPYVGGAVNLYFLDGDRYIANDEDSTNAGVNIGYRLDSPLALELGYGWDVGDADMDAITLSSYFYMDRSDEGWAPYLVASFSRFEFGDESLLTDDDDTSEQIGLGFGVSKTWGQLEVRGGAQFYVLGGDETYNDIGLNLGVNYYLNKPEAPVAAPVQQPAPEPAPPEKRTITVKLNVLFEFDKATVRAIYGDELDAVANAMKAHGDIDLVLEGHTDAIGTDAYNDDLSLRRVEAVKAKLTEVYGIPGNRISTVGYGESRPVADNSTDEGRAQNRRVVGQLSFTEVVTD